MPCETTVAFSHAKYFTHKEVLIYKLNCQDSP